MTQNNTAAHSQTPSLLDMLEDARQGQNSVNGGTLSTEFCDTLMENVRQIERSVRKSMDAGLPPAEMIKARAVAEGAQAAETILNKFKA